MDLPGFVCVFFATKNVHLLTAFLCWRSGEVVGIWRECAARGVRMRVVGCCRLPPLPAAGAHREGVLIDVHCPHTKMLLDKASVAHAFNHRYSWLLLDTAASEANGSTACGAESRPQTMLGTAAVLPDADVVWVTRVAALDVYRVAVGWPLVGTELPSPSASAQAEWTALPSSAARRRNLAGVRLSAATVVSRPQLFSGWTDVGSRAVDTFPKLTYPLMMLLAEDLNFRYDLRQVDAYGEERNGTFTGLAGLLQRGIDIGVASMFMRADRWRALHYAAETVELKGAFIFRQPSQSAVANVFALPFSRGVWVAAGCASCAAGALLAALAALARVAAAPDPALARLTLPDCFTFVVGAICQQGSELAPRLWSLRLVMFCALLSSLFTFTSYAAKVVAILQAPSDALQTIDDLTDSPLALGVQDTTYKKVYFAESEEPATQRLFRRRLAPLGERAYLGVAEGVARVRTGLFAFQVEQGSGYDVISRTFTEREKCGLKEIQAFKLPMVAVPIRRHSGYRDLVASRLRWQREVGLMSRARRLWMAEAPRCGAGGADAAGVGLRDVMGALHALLAGAAAACALLLAERLAHASRLSRLRRERTTPSFDSLKSVL